MLNKLIRYNKLNITIISLLICALFFSYYSISSYKVELYKKSDEVSINKDTYARNRNNANRIRVVSNRPADTDKEEIISGKFLTDGPNEFFGKKWLLYYLYLFYLSVISACILYIKGWFIKVTHSKFQFYQVHFIQLKDGKKDALSCIYSM